MKQRPLPIGISDFRTVIDGGYVYVDKTLLIQEIMERAASIALIPRPRRFGKTLNLSMLRYFFEKSTEDVSYLFKNLQIWQCEKYRKMQGQFPVIFLTLKDVKFPTWEETYSAIKEVVAREFQRHRYLLEGDMLFPEEKADFMAFLRKESDQTLLCLSLARLTEWMARYHKKKVFLLIDEYDAPAHAAYVGGYYEPLMIFLRNWLSAGLKDNRHLEKGIVTGILRIAKESIFSGANNISTFTILNEEFQDRFGLLESEVKELLEEYGLSSKEDQFKQWYDGYWIGSCDGIYNPWSVLNCIAKQGVFAPYWVNTSDNALMKKLIAQGTDDLKVDLEELLKGGVVQKHIEEGFIFPDLEKSPSAIWSLLLYSGYVMLDATPSYGIPCRLKISNLEVGELYRSMILDWFEKSIHENKYRLLLKSLVTGDVETFAQLFQEFLLSSVSVFDVSVEEPEKVYHAFVLGMLIGLKDQYEVKSDRESGLGRYDVMLAPKSSRDLGIVMEFKKVGRFEKMTLETAVVSALKQIEEKHYTQDCWIGE